MGQNHLLGLVLPVNYALAVDISSTDYTPAAPNGACRGLYVGTAGDVVLKDMSNNTVTYKGLAAGIVHSIRAKTIVKTGTAALNILMCY